MADARRRMRARLLRGALLRRPGLLGVAVMAVAIGASVASALLHLSSDVGRKVGRELAAFGPNLLVLPRGDGSSAGGPAGAAQAFLDPRELAPLAGEPNVTWAPVLYVLGRGPSGTVRVAGSDPDRLRALHPTWRVPAGARVWAGATLARRTSLAPGATMTLAGGAGDARRATFTVDAVLHAGGAADEMLWVPLADAQALAGRPGASSLVQARVPGTPEAVEAFARRWDGSRGARAAVLRALSATEGRLLARMHQLMALVTVAALLAAVLCAFGTLADLALERRREVALMKALGAGPREVARLFAAESLAIGAAGGALGWGIGFFFAQVIGRQVFHSAVGVQLWVPLVVLGLGLLTSLAAGVGPARWALRLEAAPVLKGD